MNRVAGLALAAAVAIGAGVWLGSAWHTRSVPAEQAGAMAAAVPAAAPSTGAPRVTAAVPVEPAALRPFEAVPMAPEAGKEASKEAVDRPPQRSFENYPRHSGR